MESPAPPVCAPLDAQRLASVRAMTDLLAGRRIAVLTGAGISTESGIPDYRGPETRRRARNPMEHQEFVGSASARRRYWARSVAGWPRIHSARPNPAHLALAEMERGGQLTGVITQNVDRLHHAAGSRNVVELHGALSEVRCLECGTIERRDGLQARLLSLNPGHAASEGAIAPDGDAEVEGPRTESFLVPGCLLCDGVLKPNVVFFGGTVPPEVVRRAWSLLDEAEVLLVVGSSLAVYSGLRFVRGAQKRGQRVVILNLGPTRGDDAAALRVEARAGEVLPHLKASLAERGEGPDSRER